VVNRTVILVMMDAVTEVSASIVLGDDVVVCSRDWPLLPPLRLGLVHVRQGSFTGSS
jgi:hypothetical protein